MKENSMKMPTPMILMAAAALSVPGAVTTAGATGGSLDANEMADSQALLLAYGPGNGDCYEAQEGDTSTGCELEERSNPTNSDDGQDEGQDEGQSEEQYEEQPEEQDEEQPEEDDGQWASVEDGRIRIQFS
jgi:hypothetical protein